MNNNKVDIATMKQQQQNGNIRVLPRGSKIGKQGVFIGKATGQGMAIPFNYEGEQYHLPLAEIEITVSEDKKVQDNVVFNLDSDQAVSQVEEGKTVVVGCFLHEESGNYRAQVLETDKQVLSFIEKYQIEEVPEELTNNSERVSAEKETETKKEKQEQL